MSRRRAPLSEDTLLGIQASTTIDRRRYNADPTEMLAELYALVGDRPDILAEQAGLWAGAREKEYGVSPAFIAALLAIPGTEPWAELGRERRAAPMHSAPPPPERY